MGLIHNEAWSDFQMIPESFLFWLLISCFLCVKSHLQRDLWGTFLLFGFVNIVANTKKTPVSLGFNSIIAKKPKKNKVVFIQFCVFVIYKTKS